MALTDLQRAEIRARYLAGEKQRDLVAEYGISKAQVWRICARDSGRIVQPGSVSVNLDVLPDLFAEAEAHGQPVAFRCEAEPPEYVRRLMSTLGLEIVTAVSVSAQALTESRDCLQPLCVETALPGLDHCRRHTSIADLRAARGNGNLADGLDALKAIDAGLPQPRHSVVVAEQEVLAPSPEPKETSPIRATKWTPDTIVAAIQQWAADHDGQPPTVSQWMRAGNGHPACSTVHERVGSFSAALKLAGFEPRPQGAQAANRNRTGSGKAPASAPRQARRKWTLPLAITAVQTFATEHGRPPKSIEQGLKNGLPSLPFAFGGGWGELLVAAGFERHQQGSAQGSGRAAAGQEPTPPVEELVTPPVIISAAPRELEPMGIGAADTAIENAARPDIFIPAETKEREAVEIVSNGKGFTLDLALTGDFTRDAQRVRDEAAKLRAQAGALDVIATGIDLLAETVTSDA